MEEPTHAPAHSRRPRRTWWTLGFVGVFVLAFVSVAFLFVGSGKPSIKTACRDYVRALDKSDEALAADAVQRLAEWRPGDADEPLNDVEWIGWLADQTKWGFILTGGFPRDSYFATALFFECGERYWSPSQTDQTTGSP